MGLVRWLGAVLVDFFSPSATLPQVWAQSSDCETGIPNLTKTPQSRNYTSLSGPLLVREIPRTASQQSCGFGFDPATSRKRSPKGIYPKRRRRTRALTKSVTLNLVWGERRISHHLRNTQLSMCAYIYI